MTTKDAMKFALQSNGSVLVSTLADLSDADILVSPVPSANHIAWQMGHLIQAEVEFFLPKLTSVAPPVLPAGFAQQHSKENAGNPSNAGYLTKDEYLALYNAARKATFAALEAIPEADFEKDSGIGAYAPTLGTVFILIATHDMMHAGQFSVVRRALGKPVLF